MLALKSLDWTNNRFINNAVSVVVCILFFEVYFYFAVMKVVGLIALKLNLVFIILMFLAAVAVGLSRDLFAVINRKALKSVFISLVVFSVFSLISLVKNEPRLHSYIFYAFAPLVLFVSIFVTYKNNQLLEQVLKVMFCFWVAISVYTHCFYWFGDFNINDYYIGSFQVATGGGYHHYLRRSIPGISSIEMATLSIFMILVGLFFIRQSQGKKQALWIAGTVILTYTFGSTGTRGAFVSFIPAVVFLILIKWFNVKSFLVSSAVFIASLVTSKIMAIRMVALAITLMSALNMPFVTEGKASARTRQEEGTAQGQSSEISQNIPAVLRVPIEAESRYRTIPSTFKLARKHVFLGMGFTPFLNIQKHEYSVEHDHVLAMLVQLGIVSTLAYVSIIICMLILLFKTIKLIANQDPRARNLGVILMAGAVFAFFDMHFAARNYLYYWIWFGFCLAWINNCQASLEQKEII